MGKSGADASSVSPPAGTGSVAGMGESFSLDLNSGQGTYSLPFEVPDGVAGHKPMVKLEYSHGVGNGPFGQGWRLQVREISRRLDHGVPRFDGSGGPDQQEVFLEAGTELRQSADGRFRAVREMAFSQYERVDDHWVVREKNGSRLLLGRSAEARVADPDDPSRVQTWMLSRHEDAHGNQIDYEYETVDGQAYLRAISYAKFVVRFTYEERPDVVVNGRAGFLRRTTRRCSAISLHLAADDRPARTLRLSYTQAPHTGVSMLTSAQLVARAVSQGAGPTGGPAVDRPDVVRNPTTFEYATFDPRQLQVRLVSSPAGHAPPPPLTDPDTALVALDDLPLPGILANRNGRHFYWPNDGGRWGAPRPLGEAPFAMSFGADGVQLLDMDGSGTADMLVGVGSNPVNGFYRNAGARGFADFVAYSTQQRVLPPLESGRVRLGDLDGDGVVDGLYTTSRGLVSFRNRGRDGWETPSIGAGGAGGGERVDFADRLTHLADMTGDGLPDIVQVRSGRTTYRPNLGHGRFGDEVVMASSPRLDGIVRAPDELVLVDVDGDGCADLVRVSSRGVEVHLNRSGAGFAPPVVLVAVPVPIPGTVRAVDLDGTAAPGLLYNTMRGGEVRYVHLSWSRPAPTFGLLRSDNGVGTVHEIGYVPLVEMALADRAGGRPWSTQMPFPLWLVATTTETDQVRGRVTRTRYRYRDGHYDSLFRRFQGFREVERREIGDDSRADVLTRHTFLMDQAAVPGHTREHAHLDRMLAEVAVFSDDGTPEADRPYRREVSEYDVEELEVFPDGTKRVFALVTATSKHFHERGDDERIEERSFAYDDVGNVVRETCRGRGVRAGAAAQERLVTTEISYATDPSGLVSKPAQTVKRDAANAVVAEVRQHYDGLPLGSLSRGLLTREEHLVLPQSEFDVHYAGMDASSLGYLSQPDADGTPAVFALESVKTYTPEGNLASERSGRGRTTTKEYDADHLHVVQQTTNGKVSRRVNEPLTGKPTEILAHTGARVRMAYDAAGRLTAYLVADDTPDNPTRALSYDSTSVPNSVRMSYRIDESTRSDTVTYYDGSDAEVQRRVERAPGEVVVSGWTVQNPWRQTRQEFEPTLDDTFAFAVPDTAGRPSRSMGYDGTGRLVRSVNHNGATSSAVFEPFAVVISDALDLTPGHPAADTPRREEVDVWNQRTATVDIGAGGEQLTTRFEIGLFGEVLSMADDAGTICTYRYDLRGNRLFLDHRDAGRREQWFDSHNDVVRTRDASGNDVGIDRDGDGRVVRVELDGTEVEAFTYDDTSAGADGRLAHVRYPGGEQEFSYGSRGFLARHTVVVDGQCFELAYEHDDTGRQLALTYPDGSRVRRHHTLNGMVRRIDDVVDAIDYDARNLPVRIAFANGVTTAVEYEPGVGHVRRQRTVAADGTVLEEVSFTYDELMQLSGRNDEAPDVRSSMTYERDGLNQLSRVEGEDAQGPFTLDYTYARGYNLAGVGESGWELRYDDGARPDRLTAVTPPGAPSVDVAHDANGNATSLPGRALAYNYKNQLERVTLADGTAITYDYDYRGNLVRRRAVRQGNTTTTILIGRLVEARAGDVTNFVILDRRRIAAVRGGVTRWLHLDPLGSTSFSTDDAGTRLSQVAYHPFGTERRRIGAPEIRTFALHDLDEDTGLIFMGHRWYVPEAGRFLSPDPLYLYSPERSEGDPHQLRLYTYVGNRPLDNVDPAGLSFWSVVGAVVGVVVGVVVAIVVVAAFASGIGLGLLAVAGLIALMTVSYAVAANNQGSALGEFFRGFMIGLNAGMNATFLAMMGPVGAFLGGFLGTMIFLGSIDEVAGLDAYQGIMGWSNWFMPMSWLVVGIGAIMWVLNGLGHLFLWEIPNLWGGGVASFRITGFKMDWSTGMLATKGGWVSNANPIQTAYNMGNFAYVDNASSGWHLDHEAGHNLNLAVYGSVFHFIGFIDEMVAGNGSGAYSEQLADSNDGHPGMWS
jgi:RHS repeat-associated protein